MGSEEQAVAERDYPQPMFEHHAHGVRVNWPGENGGHGCLVWFASSDRSCS